MPAIARKIHEVIQEAPAVIPWPLTGSNETQSTPEHIKQIWTFLNDLETGQKINPPEVLFAKISDEQVAQWRTRFSGVGEA